MADFGDTTDLEKHSLEAHVDLCAMRYQQLDLRLKTLEVKMDAVQKEIIDGSKSLKTIIISSTTTIIVGIIGLITTILMKF
jgi:hypothetical protein